MKAKIFITFFAFLLSENVSQSDEVVFGFRDRSGKRLTVTAKTEDIQQFFKLPNFDELQSNFIAIAQDAQNRAMSVGIEGPFSTFELDLNATQNRVQYYIVKVLFFEEGRGLYLIYFPDSSFVGEIAF